MSLQSYVGNMGSAYANSGQITLTWATGMIENIVGSVKTGLGSIWGGGFAGISEAKLNGELIPAIEKYCETISSSINQFNAEADVTSSFAGPEVQAAVSEFVSSVKELLIAYVSTMKQEIAAAQGAYQQYQSGAQSVGSNVSSTAQEIRGAASGIKLD